MRISDWSSDVCSSDLFAEVAIHCDTGGAVVAGLSDATDGHELEVIRRIERGAGSAYRANSRDVRAKDVALIFADAATGAHSPALVSQGKLANVIAAKPTERRAMRSEENTSELQSLMRISY